MNPIVISSILILAFVVRSPAEALQAQLPSGWQTLEAQQQPQPQFATSQLVAAPRQPIAAELQNQVSALSAQLAAANRQLQYFQQQLSLASQQPQQPQVQQLQQPTSPQLAHQLLQSVQQQQQLQAPQSIGSLQAAQQQFYAQPSQQEPPQISTLVDGTELTADPRISSANRVYYQPQQQPQPQPQPQQLQQVAPIQTSTTASPLGAIEASLVEPQQEQQQPQPQQLQQAPRADQAPPHNPPKNDDKFSIGLGVLSPGYTQKFGNTALDFNQDKNGFSFTLSNNGHNNQPQQQAKTDQQQPKAA